MQTIPHVLLSFCCMQRTKIDSAYTANNYLLRSSAERDNHVMEYEQVLGFLQRNMFMLLEVTGKLEGPP